MKSVAIIIIFVVNISPAWAKRINCNETFSGQHFSGLADYYADKFHGRKTASGIIHDRNKLTAAHRTLPFGTHLKVVNKHNGKSCTVVVNDRGPFTAHKVIDLSHEAARQIGSLSSGTVPVDCYILTNKEEPLKRLAANNIEQLK